MPAAMPTLETLTECIRPQLEAVGRLFHEELRSDLGVRWAAFHAEHRGGRGVSGDDIEPEAYIEANS